MKIRSPFLNSIADFMLSRQYSLRTIDTYLKWIASFIHFHGKRHPASMGDNEVVEYLVKQYRLDKNINTMVSFT